MTFIYEFTHTTTFGSVPIANVMHAQATAGGQASLSGLNAAIGAFAGFYTQLSSHIPAGSRFLVGAKVVEFEDSSPGDRQLMATSAQFPSAPDGVNPLPPTAAVCINWHTGLPGRSRRGRTFFGPLITGDLTEGYLNGTTRNSIQSSANGLLTALEALPEPFTLVVWSRKLSNAASIETATTDVLIDHLNSRKR